MIQIEFNGARIFVEEPLPEDGILPPRFINAVCRELAKAGRNDLAQQFAVTQERRPQPAVYRLPE